MHTLAFSEIILLIGFLFHLADAQDSATVYPLQDNSISLHSVSFPSKSEKVWISVFKPNEAVSIQVFPDSTSFFNGVYKIDEQGCINLPVIGKLYITDLSESALIDTIKSRCIDYLPFPNINISPMIRLSLFGGFYKPGLYWIDSQNSLWDAIQMAGGLMREDGLKLLRWERDGKVISNNLISLYQSGTSLKSIGFCSGDQLCITARPKVELSFREHFVPFFTLFLTALSTGLSIYTLSR